VRRQGASRVWRRLGLGLALAGTLALGARVGAEPVTDMVGRPVRVPERATRVVSLAPSVTEIVYALGAGDRLVGVTDHCDYPPETSQKVKVGGFYAPNFEMILSLRPDLILATSIEGGREEVFRGAEAFRAPVYVVRPLRVRSVLESIERIGRLLGHEHAAGRLVQGLEAELDAIARAVAGRRAPRVLYVLWGNPLIVPGRETLITELLQLAGGESVSGREVAAYPRFAAEEAVARRPEVVVLAQHGEATVDRQLREWPHLALLPAARQGRVHQVDGDLTHRPGPRLIEGLRRLARIIHPDAFPRPDAPPGARR
jgi:iron complex transport system substrate-binding protein